MVSRYTDEHGYKRNTDDVDHSTLIHRQIAYERIYQRNREQYPLPFSEYVVHHIDGNKKNNKLSNLMLLLQDDHDKIHGYHEPTYAGSYFPRRSFFGVLIDELFFEPRALLWWFIIIFVGLMLLVAFFTPGGKEQIFFWLK